VNGLLLYFLTKQSVSMPFGDATIRVGPIFNLPKILRDLGHSAEAVVNAAGLDQELLSDPENRISMVRLGTLVASAARHTKRPDMGLLIADTFGPQTFGLVGKLVAEGPDVRASLRNLERMQYYHDKSAYIALKAGGGQATLSYELKNSSFDGARIVLDGAIGIGLRLMQALCGKDWQASEVQFSRRKPHDAKPYRNFFKSPVYFDAPTDALLFPSCHLDYPVVQSPRPDAHPAGMNDIRPFSEVIRHQIALRLGLAPITSADVAAVLGTSRRTIDRQLAEEGTTFHTLVENMRYARARHLLAGGEAPLMEVAFAVGYPELSTFSRAFKRWAGASPHNWRALNKSVD
jgi:AraC-like DNA-binding protein